MTKIKIITAQEILVHGANPLAGVDVIFDNGIMGWEGVPSGASTGSKEAVELGDNDKMRYLGKDRPPQRDKECERDHRAGDHR